MAADNLINIKIFDIGLGWWPESQVCRRVMTFRFGTDEFLKKFELIKFICIIVIVFFQSLASKNNTIIHFTLSIIHFILIFFIGSILC